MPRADFFARLGLFVDTEVFDLQACTSLREAMLAAPGKPATVVERQGPSNAIDEETRRTRSATVPPAASSLVEERLLAVKPSLERHFNVTLSRYQKPQFLVYRKGDFFRPHPDISTDPDAPEFAKERRVSVVIFVNGETTAPEPGSYCGGSLTFYGLLDNPRVQNIGLPLIGQTGLLIGFRPEIVHEVTKVTDGERYTIVSWFV